jgi:transcriptional regulator with XRE-family HTH domain
LRGKNELYTTDTGTPDGKTHEPEAVCRKVTGGPEHVSKWETGKARPSLEYLYKMEAVLGCTLKDLFDVDTE